MAKYPVSRKKFIELMRTRPALIKTVQGLTEDVALEAVKSSSVVWDYLPDQFKTVEVAKIYLMQDRYDSSAENVPLEIRNKLPLGFLKRLMEEHHNYAKSFPSMPYEAWLVAAANGFDDIETIPEQFVTTELLTKLLEHIVSINTNNTFSMPDKYWTSDNCELVVKYNPAMITEIPPDKITNKVLRLLADHTDTARVFDGLELKGVPDSSWDDYTVVRLVEKYPHVLKNLPKKHITEFICILAAKKGLSIEYIPIKTRAVYVQFIAHCHVSSSYFRNYIMDDDDKKKIGKIPYKNDPDFQMEVLKEGSIHGVETLQLFDAKITEETWLAMLKLNAYVLKRIDKKNQTDAMVKTFLESTQPEDIDELDKYINLSKIHKEYVPFLLNCESAIIKGIMNKKLLSREKEKVTDPDAIPAAKVAEVVKQSGSTLVIDISPAEYTDLKFRLN